MQEKGKEGHKTELVVELLKSRKGARSQKTRAAAIQCEQELEQLKDGSTFDRLVAWYYENVCSGYGFLVKAKGEVRSRRGWITPMALKSHLGGYESPRYLGIRPAERTNWAVIDIDEGSRYHPASEEGEGIEPVLDSLKTIGLVSGLEFQSSTTGGIHIWFPLKEGVKPWDLAYAIEEAILMNGLELKNGVLEVRPNCKAWGSNFQGIRAPLTGEGNALFVEDIGLVEELGALKKRWMESKEDNEFMPISKSTCKGIPSSNRRGQSNMTGKLLAAQERVHTGFTGRRQTHELKLACLQVARLIEGLEGHEEIRKRVTELLVQAPGFEEFCSHKMQIRRGKYLTYGEIETARRLTPGGYRDTWKERANEKRRLNARKRAEQALEEAYKRKISFSSLSKAFLFMQTQGAPTRSWWYKSENTDLLQKLKIAAGIQLDREKDADPD